MISLIGFWMSLSWFYEKVHQAYYLVASPLSTEPCHLPGRESFFLSVIQPSNVK